jgi:hypothetical protein
VCGTEFWAWKKADISRITVTELRFLEAQKETSRGREQKVKNIGDNLKINTLEDKLINNRRWFRHVLKMGRRKMLKLFRMWKQKEHAQEEDQNGNDRLGKMSCRRKEKYLRRSRRRSRKAKVAGWDDPLESRSVRGGRRRIFYVIENMVV